VIPDVLVNLLATVVAALAVVGVRVLRVRADPDDEIPVGEWQKIAAQVGGAVLLLLGVVYFVAFVISGVGRLGENYVRRLGESLAESPNATEGQRRIVEVSQGIVADWGWAWSWPYALALLVTLYLGSMVVGGIVGLLDENRGATILYLVLAIPGTLVGAAVGLVGGYFAHLGVDAGFKALYESSRPQVEMGQLDLYPSSELIRLTWPVQQSAVTSAFLCAIAAFLWVSYLFGRRVHFAQVRRTEPEGEPEHAAAAPRVEPVHIALSEVVQRALIAAHRQNGSRPVQTAQVLVCLSQADGLSQGWDRFWGRVGYPDQTRLKAAEDGHPGAGTPFEYARDRRLTPSLDLDAALRLVDERARPGRPVVPGEFALALLSVPDGGALDELTGGNLSADAVRDALAEEVLG
jgi:hypothetical protein